MPRHRRPVDVGLHRLAPADRVARKKQEPPEAPDLVELLLAVLAADLDAVFLNQQRHQLAPIAFAIALDAADLVEKARQDARVGIAHAAKGISAVRAHIFGDQRLARLERPFVQPIGGVVDVAVKEAAMIRVIKDLPDRRAGAFRHHPIDDAFALGHPGAWKAHICRLL